VFQHRFAPHGNDASLSNSRHSHCGVRVCFSSGSVSNSLFRKKNCGAPEPNADAPHHPERVHLISFETPPTSRLIAF
jgi:hypothetical protein